MARTRGVARHQGVARTLGGAAQDWPWSREPSHQPPGAQVLKAEAPWVPLCWGAAGFSVPRT